MADNTPVDWNKCIDRIPSGSGYGVDDKCVLPPEHHAAVLKKYQVKQAPHGETHLAINIGYKPPPPQKTP